MAKYTTKEEVLNERVREGLKVQCKRQAYMYVGVVSKVISKVSFELAGAKMLLTEGQWKYDGQTSVVVLASDNWDVLEVKDA